jgi:hypothetical protein
VPRVCPTMHLSACFTGCTCLSTGPASETRIGSGAYPFCLAVMYINTVYICFNPAINVNEDIFQSPSLFMLDSASVGIKSFLTRAPVAPLTAFQDCPCSIDNAPLQKKCPSCSNNALAEAWGFLVLFTIL